MSVVYGTVHKGKVINPGSGNWDVDGTTVRFARNGRTPTVVLSTALSGIAEKYEAFDGGFHYTYPEDRELHFVVYP